MKTTKNGQKTPKQIKLNTNGSNSTKDPVQAYCRLRPMKNESEESCLKLVSQSSVLLSPPTTAVNYRANFKEVKYKFRRVFDADIGQNEIFNEVARPLVENLVRGRNGLLFTYGVTGSGKTYTMVGDKQNPGLMQRSIDVLFKTIANNHAKKFIFKPDKLNGFDVQSEADACAERHAELSSKYSKTPKRCNSDLETPVIAEDLSVVEGVDDDNIYSVFVTFAEIYNNSIYDLLEESANKDQRSLQNRMIREDGAKNMYLHGITEIECKSTEEAVEIFNRGLRRKRMGCTNMNSESSRSHSVFTIRLVQAPTDQSGENVIQEKRVVCISQLSLVDLAGSERAVRTKNSGTRLREACCINNSLMTLRSCLDILRENQMTGSNKIVPYRDSKLTHLFKNFFDGEGQVKMIICVNPRAEDYDETLQVMKFAEMTQEVQVSRAMTFKLDNGLTPGRRKANREIKQALINMKEAVAAVDLGLVYNLGTFPIVDWTNPPSDGVNSLKSYLERRMAKRAELLIDVAKKEEKLRSHILNTERERLALKTEVRSLKTILLEERLKITSLEEKIILYEEQIHTLKSQLLEKESMCRHHVQEINEKALLLNQNMIEKEKQERVFQHKIALETEKMSKDHEIKLKKQRAALRNELKTKTQKIRMASKILDNNKFLIGSQQSEDSASSVESYRTPRKAAVPVLQAATHNVQHSKRGVAVANSRHRRSRSADCEVWLEHRGPHAVPLGTVMQPMMRKRKSVTKLTDVKDVANMKTSKYCLFSQEQDSGGELETRLYKGDVIPSCGGGAQVIFNDVELLKQCSPKSSPTRKRINEQSIQDLETVESRCSVAIEGNKKARMP